MRVLFCCDATPVGGIGHAVRSAAIAAAARSRGWEVVVSGRLEAPLAVSALRDAGAKTILPAAEDAEDLVQLAQRENCGLIHLDTYSPWSGLREAAEAEGLLVSSIEDGTWGRRDAHIVIDAHPRSVTSHRSESTASDLRLGAAYLPLRPVVADLAARTGTRGRDPIRSVLIMMGGTDAADASAALASALVADEDLHEIRVVRSDAGSPLPQDARVARRSPTSDLAALVDGVDLVVTAAGTSVWEFAAIGLPMAVVRVTGNQTENYSYLVDEEFATGLGDVEDAPGRWGGVDASEARRRAGRVRHLVDGRGAGRIVEAWEEVLGESEPLAVRAARGDDASTLFDWRNDPAVRRMSRSVDEVGWDQHLAWLERVLGDPSRDLLLLRSGRRSVGTVRFDHTATGATEVSITVAPEVRGRGLARPMLEEAIGWLARRDGVPTLEAYMKSENLASQRAFAAVGFEEAESSEAGFLRLLRP